MKDLSKKLVPIIHAIKTSPNMMMEMARIPLPIKRQNKDWQINYFPSDTLTNTNSPQVHS